MYQEFWTQLGERLADTHPDWPAPQGTAKNWIDLPSGYRLAHWSLSFARAQRLRSELYLEASVDTDARYEELAAVAREVDAAYGSPLSWEPLSGKKSCRVAD